MAFRGSFAQYGRGSKKASYPEDEEAIFEAADYMMSMCGNPGQEAILGEVLGAFEDWAIAILENESDHRGANWAEFVEMVIMEWYEGDYTKWAYNTDQIWVDGWTMIAEQSGYHDNRDEQGEGTGNEFGQ